jgi:hypothetical protein
VALTFTSVVGLVGGTALALAPTAGAGAVGTELFSSGTPGFHADAAEVPPDVCFVTIAADGGSGGAFTTAPVAQVAALATIPGGSGATVSARFAVTPGQVLDAFVGGAGQSPPTGTDAGHGGNGGLGGGAGGGGGNLGNAAGAGGGGASAVSTGGQPLVVAGGGGYTSGNPNGGGGGGGYGAGAGGAPASMNREMGPAVAAGRRSWPPARPRSSAL